MVVCLSLFLVIVMAMPGCSQLVNLTSDRAIVCPGDDSVSYTCNASAPEVQWIVGQFIPASGSNAVTIANILSRVGTMVLKNGIIAEHVSFDPFLTRLTVNPNVVNSSVNVTCSTSGLPTPERATLRYFLDYGSSVKPVSGVNATPIVNNNSHILVQFVRSRSPGITNYIINCTDQNCTQTVIEGTEEDAFVETSSGSTDTVCVYAVNRCGRTSNMSCTDKVEMISPAGLSPGALAGIVVASTVIPISVVVILAVVIGCCKYKKVTSEKRIGNEGAVGFAVDDDKVDTTKQ